MFSDAYSLAKTFTGPVIVSNKFLDGTVTSGCGAFVVVNDEGWIITVAHVFAPQLKSQQDAGSHGPADDRVLTLVTMEGEKG